MKKIVFIVIVLISTLSLAQTDQSYEKAMEDFKNHYNSKQYDSIYSLFAESMKKAISKDNIKMQMDAFHQMAGNIESYSLLKSFPTGKIFMVNHKLNVWEYQIALDANGKMTGLRPQPHTPPDVKVIERNTTSMSLPFKEAWYVFWGGTEVSQNYHVAHKNQKYAYDIMMVKDGSSFKGDSKKNENYYVFGKDLIAPCDAIVVKVITGVHDNIPGELNPAQLTGNTVVLETKNKEYLLFAHLKQGSIVVKEGQQIAKGELIGQCGNSGNTTEPHLHLSLQNQIDMFGAIGGKLLFDKILVNGELKEDYLPVKGDIIQNIKN